MNLKVCCLIIFVFAGMPTLTQSAVSVEKPDIEPLTKLQANSVQDDVSIGKLVQAPENATTNTRTSASTVSDASNEKVAIALITAGGAALGALIAAAAAAYSAQIKIREIKLNYEYQLRDKYLNNASIQNHCMYH
jgi:hypothetical protein